MPEAHRTTLRVALLWHSLTSGNLGIVALTLAQIESARTVARSLGREARFTLLCWSDPRPPGLDLEDIDIVPLRMADFAPGGRLLHALANCDLAIDIGAGDSFSDLYGRPRVLKMLLAQRLAAYAGRPVVLAPQTIGPFTDPLVQRLALEALRRARAVAVRDALSADYLQSIGFERPVIISSDLALRLPYAPPVRSQAGPLRIGLNVSGLLERAGRRFGLSLDYPRLVRRIARWAVSLPGTELHLIGHVFADNLVDDDRWAAERLAAEVPGAKLAPVFPGPVEAKSYIAGLDLFLGSRMHACIAAFSAGVPVLPLAYSRKFAGLFLSLGYDHLVDLRSTDEDAAMALVERSAANRAFLAAAIAPALARGVERVRLYEDLLADVILSQQQRAA